MKKKIIDISPPKKVTERQSQETFEEKIFLKETSEKPTLKKRNLKFLFAFILTFFLILVIYIGGYFVSELTLYLVPGTEPEVFESEIKINISQTIPDFQEKIIPGNFFTGEEEKWQKFEATGKDSIGEKAQGIIRVYNSHTPPRSITLKATTRFLSAEGGKIFRAPEKIYLPPAEIKGGKTVPSFKDVKVEAQEVGEEYNIISTKFSVPGLTGTSLYYTVWAESDKSMEGGFKKEVKILTEKDLEEAEKNLEKDIEDIAKNSLKTQLPEDFVSSQGADFTKDVQISCIEKAGDQVAEFNCQGKIKIGTLAFRLSDLKELAINFIESNISSSKDFDLKSLSLEYSARNLLEDQGKMILGLKIRVNIYEKISKEALISKIKGRPEQEIKEIVFEDCPQVKKVEFKFWPFWVRKAPESSNKIRIELQP